jgi:hypothetical protein
MYCSMRSFPISVGMLPVSWLVATSLSESESELSSPSQKEGDLRIYRVATTICREVCVQAYND